MAHDTMVSLRGYVGGNVELRMAGDTPVANIRVASTPSHYRQSTQSWVDGPTQWYTVHAWRALGEHCAQSLDRGDPVIVHGRLHHRTYVNKNNVEVLSLEIDALMVGHDLNRGVSTFTKAVREHPAPARPNEATREESAA